MFESVFVDDAVTVISLVSATVPVVDGNVRVAAPLVMDEITGVVKVLFVRVSVPARVAKSASVTAVLNCAKVPDTVFEPSAIVLFVNVSEPASEATSASLTAVFN